MVLGLGTVHPRARVNHFGFQNNDPDTVSKQGVANTAWHGYSESSPRSADAGINLGFNFPELDSGASVTFSFAYVLDEADLDKAMGSINELIMTQPTGTVGGDNVDIACRVESSSPSLSSSVAVFTIIRGGVEKLSTTSGPCVPELAPSTGCTFSVSVNTLKVPPSATKLESASDYEFKCSVQIGTFTSSNPPKETSAVVEISNPDDPPVLRLVTPDPTIVPASFNNNPTTPTVVKVERVSGSWSEVKFFRENAVIGGVTSKLIHTDSSPGATSQTTIDVSDLADGFPLTVKVVAKQSGGGDGFLTISGTVAEPNAAPTNIALSGSTVAENSPATTTIAVVTVTDPNPTDAHTFTVTGSDFEMSGDNLVVKSVPDFEASASKTRSVTITARDPEGLTFSKTFAIVVTDVNEPPSGMTLSHKTVNENAAVGTVVGTLSVVNPESAAGQTVSYFLTASSSGRFSLTGNTLKVAGGLDYEVEASRDITIRATDNGSPAKFVDTKFDISITDLNEAPYDIKLTYKTGSNIMEQCPDNLTPKCNTEVANVHVVGTLTSTDDDAGDSHTYAIVPGGDAAQNKFAISGNKMIVAVTDLDYERTNLI
jgi:hypothetical protein